MKIVLTLPEGSSVGDIADALRRAAGSLEMGGRNSRWGEFINVGQNLIGSVGPCECQGGDGGLDAAPFTVTQW